MDVLQISLLGILGAMLALTVRQYRPEIAMQVGLVTGLLIFFAALDAFTGVVDYVRQMARSYGLDSTYLGVVVKIIGMAYIAEFAVQVCRDAGENAVAAKVEMGGKALLLALTLPVVSAILDMVVSLMPR